MASPTPPPVQQPIPSSHSIILPLPPSCAAFSGLFRGYMVVGTYELQATATGTVVTGAQTLNVEGVEAETEIETKTEKEEKEEASSGSAVGEEGEETGGGGAGQKRKGSVVLLRVSDDKITPVQTIPTPSAIFDLHFHPSLYDSTDIIGAVTSTGSLHIYRLTRAATGSNVPELQHAVTLQILPESSLITAFTWHPSTPGKLALTTSDGEVKLFQIQIPHVGAVTGSDGTEFLYQEIDTNTSLFTHELEAWTSAFTPAGTGLFSGGDDSILAFNNATSASEDAVEDSEIQRQPWQNRKIHGAGVTAILPLSDEVVVTGSYDDSLRIISTPSFGQRRVLAEENLGGGVWRLKVIHQENNHDGSKGSRYVLLVCCMHAGARIVELLEEEDSWTVNVLGRFEEHKSMCYASDDLAPESDDQTWSVVSTSFYDRLVCLWSCKI